MERHEFIQKIIELYPDTFKAERLGHVQAWVEMYEKALPKSWDFDKLMWYFATQYKSTVAPPHPSFFFSFANDVKPSPRNLIIENPEEKLTPEEEEAKNLKRKKFFSDYRKLITRMTINKG